MKFSINIYIIYIFLFAFGSLQAAGSQKMYGSGENNRIIVNNRILAKVNGKLISTHDVMKKMDIIFLKQFAEYTSSPIARFKFYEANWKAILDELVNKELILADAEENKVEVTSGDIRQEMESMFGPNIIENLDKIGMTFDEATEILKGELIIKRMIAQNVHSRAIRLATPNKTRQAYEEYIRKPENIRATEWRYKVLTIKDRNTQKAAVVADSAFKLLTEESIAPENIIDTLKERQLIGRRTKISLSGEIINKDNELSESYKEVLAPMETGMISAPTFQKSRSDSTSAYRIFCVIQKTPGGTPPFKEVESKLKDEVLGAIIDVETDLYLDKLRKHFHFQDISTNTPHFEPFVLK